MKRLLAVVTVFLAMAFSLSPVWAASDITNPLSGNQSTVGSVLNGFIGWALGAVAAVAGAWFLFHLYKAIMLWMAGSHHAQKREEAKSHFVHVAIAGVVLGAAGVIAGALYNLGGSFH
ncbi:hypothetical protein [Alicyclobacillus macrosporangiidus]|uniref:hypothetical protein n=1 Tax=Alicyclobacillus macrosporangiidus TaxID=392015 RepID=UPI000496D793|nr:hypothetical protein [Alicyclobacillus macrosporangiidus]